ncbi:MAG TPA: FG-GAP-like repeat-containing protein, partial [Dongiaceae bacterium]|nr:FG-GAP-like repeat-containing protein [Dongiaceae bacterium]
MNLKRSAPGLLRALRYAGVIAASVALIADATAPRAGLLAPRPGPIDRPLALAVGDFDRDGIDDLVVADYQAAVLNLLVGRADGTFVAHPLGPIGVGTASIGNPTTGPFQLIAVDLDPEDVDADTVPNAKDNCPNVINLPETDGTQADTNHNGVGNACEAGTDSDGDGTIDVTIDTDGDGIVDFDPVTGTLDNCPRRPNPLQEDTEVAAGTDGVCGTADDNPLLYGTDALCGTADDRIGDGVGDACQASLDLLILSASAGAGSVLGTLRVRMNTGAGGFVTRRSYSTSIGPGDFAAADYNKDGHIDVALTATTFKAVEVFPGLGDGLFNLPAIFNTGEGPQGVIWADLDGDKDADLVVANRADDSLSVFNNAAGVLSTVGLTVPATGDAPVVLLAGRINTTDALDDLVVIAQGEHADHGSLKVFLGSPTGALVAGQSIDLGTGHVPRAGVLTDLDGDGRVDLALADFDAKNATVFTGVGDGTFAGPTTTVTLRDQPTDIEAIDLPPAGGAPDLAVLQFNARVDLLQNAGSLAFAPAPTTPASIWKDTRAMAFFGADLASGGDLVLLEGAAGRFDVLSGIGDNSFRYQSTQTLAGLTATPPADARFLQVADVSYNNRPDMAI